MTTPKIKCTKCGREDDITNIYDGICADCGCRSLYDGEENPRFSNEMLLEIEKGFDVLAGLQLSTFSKLLSQLKEAGVNQADIDKLWSEQISTYTMYRTISAIANTLQKR